MNSLQLATEFLEQKLSGRDLTNTHILPLLKGLSNRFKVQIEGKSVLGKDIYSVQYKTLPDFQILY